MYTHYQRVLWYKYGARDQLSPWEGNQAKGLLTLLVGQSPVAGLHILCFTPISSVTISPSYFQVEVDQLWLMFYVKVYETLLNTPSVNLFVALVSDSVTYFSPRKIKLSSISLLVLGKRRTMHGKYSITNFES